MKTVLLLLALDALVISSYLAWRPNITKEEDVAFYAAQILIGVAMVLQFWIDKKHQPKNNRYDNERRPDRPEKHVRGHGP